jgi:hypothetical protein
MRDRLLALADAKVIAIQIPPWTGAGGQHIKAD